MIVDDPPDVAMARLVSSVTACRRCEALVTCRSRAVPGAGCVPAKVMFIGIAPGRLGGDRTGIPFTGDRSGQLLRAMIAGAGIESVFISNVVRCNPRDFAGRNRYPTSREIANCREYLVAEFAIVRPRVVACLGRIAWEQVAGRTIPFLPRRGLPIEVGGMIVFPMYHPAFVNRGAYSIRLYRKDFERLSRLYRSAAAQ